MQSVQQICRQCEGKGVLAGKACFNCEGTGAVCVLLPIGACTACHGSGRKGTSLDDCETCFGTGWIRTRRVVTHSENGRTS